MSDASALIDPIKKSQAKRDALKAILLRMAEKKQKNNADNQNSDASSIKAVENGPFPLSLNQKTMWLIHEMAPDTSAYNTVFAMKFNEPVALEKLENACLELFAKHPMLRAKLILSEDEQPTLEVNQKATLDWQTIDGSQWSEEQLNDNTREFYRKPFELLDAPPIRAYFIHRAGSQSVFMMVIHHILYDGWSLWLMIEELEKLYLGVSIPSPTVQYRQFVSNQTQYLRSQEGQQQLDYWRTQLKTHPPEFNLPQDFPRPKLPSFNGDSVEFRLSSSKTEQIKRAAKSLKVTPYVWLLSVYNIMLARYSGVDDLIICAPVSGRSDAKWFKTVGCFVNTLPIRHQIYGDDSFVSFVAHVKNNVVNGLKHQDVPLKCMTDDLGMSSQNSSSQMFRISFVLQKPNNNKIAELMVPREGRSCRWGGLSVESYYIPQQEGQFDLTLEMVDCADEFVGAFRYSSELFLKERIETMRRYFEILLDNCLETPEVALSSLGLLTTEETNKQLGTWTDNSLPLLEGLTIHGIFERQAVKTPHAIAAVHKNIKINFEELNWKVNQLGHYLISKGIRSESLVAICMIRSLDMLTAVLAILKAGGSYVPLDPSYPKDRIEYMLKDSSAKWVLTESTQLHLLKNSDIDAICLDVINVSGFSQYNPEINIRSDCLAFVIYTSGSTGLPKGVMIEHASCIALITWAQAAFDFTQLSHVLVSTSITFDLSVFEMFVPLSQGGTLYIVENALALADDDFDYPISLINTVPSVISTLYQLQAIPQSVNTINLAGEKLEQSLVEKLYSLDHIDNVYDLYGPSECTTYSTYTRREPYGCYSIGRAINNTSTYILDKNRAILPIGAIGELYVGGAGLARGYLNNEELTQEKFIENPYKPNSRLYKTGDLARFYSSGEIEYLGRLDDQVKIRGFRIELGEIEQCIANDTAVKQCVVMAKETNSGNAMLSAFIVINENNVLNVADLKSELSSILPGYMIPNSMLVVDDIPLTSNGKVNKKALLVLEQMSSVDQPSSAPTTSEEKALADIFASVLNTNRIGINDNFFEFGGDSILSIQVVSRAKQDGIYFSIKDLFKYQTVSSLISNIKSVNVDTVCEQGFVQGEASYSPIQSWFSEEKFRNHHHWNQMALFKLDKCINISMVREIADTLEKQHDALRLRFSHAQHHSAETNFRIEEVDFSTESKKLGTVSQGKLITDLCNRCQQSLNIEHGPLWKLLLIKTPAFDTHNRLFIVIHHLVVDGVSWRILLEDFISSALLLIGKTDVLLGEKTTSFQCYSESLRKLANKGRFDQDIEYWKRVIDTESVSFSKDLSEGENSELLSNDVKVEFDLEQTNTLLTNVNTAYNTTINDILISALLLTLQDWTGHANHRIYMEGHGRDILDEHIDNSRTVGWFTALFPASLYLPSTKDIGIVVKSIKEQLRRIPLNGISYGILRYLHSDQSVREDLTDKSGIGMLFNYLGQFVQLPETDRLVEYAEESVGNAHGKDNHRVATLELNASIIRGRLVAEFSYCEAQFYKSTIGHLANNFKTNLMMLVDHCAGASVQAYTPSDFPLANLSQDELDDVLKTHVNLSNIESIYPLSPMQAGMLFHSLYDKGRGAYIRQMKCDIMNEIDIPRFELVWKILIAQHSILRSIFLYEEVEMAHQIVLKEVTTPFKFVDLSGISEKKQKEEIYHIGSDALLKDFTLNSAPLMRINLVKCADSRFTLILTHHHILMDGWSIPILFDNVLEVYSMIESQQRSNAQSTRHWVETFSSGKLADYYQDFIEYLSSYDKVKASLYWREYLKGLKTVLPLNIPKRPLNPQIDRLGMDPANEHLSRRYTDHSVLLSKDTTTNLTRFANSHRITLNTLVQGAWAIVLQRYNQQDEVLFGVTNAGRPPELNRVEERIGLYINTTPLRVAFHKRFKLLDWLKQLQDQQVEMREFQFSGINEIQSLSAVDNTQALFESIVVFENYPMSKIEHSGKDPLDIGHVDVHEYANYPLTVVASGGEQLKLLISYDNSIYESIVIKRLLDHNVNALNSLVSANIATCGEIDILSREEKQQLLHSFNKTKVEFDSEKAIHQMFEDQVQRTPKNVALFFENKAITYRALNQQINQLARCLIKKGVGPGSLVAICLERSPEMIMSLLAVLKVGAAYVPIDPHYPKNRIQYMLVDSQVLWILCHSINVSLLSSEIANVLCVDTLEFDAEPDDNLGVVMKSSELAYVIYTSGSTGQPKGVMIDHRGIVNLAQAQIKEFEVMSADRVLQFASFSFDAAVSEIVMALFSGASLVLCDRSVTRDVSLLQLFLRERHISVVTLPPALLSLMDPQSMPEVKSLISAGELCPLPIAERFSKDRLFFNAYGPTENSVCASIYRFTRENGQLQRRHTIPIGTAIDNTQLYLLDQDKNLLPKGVSGELHIGGVGLSRGYLNKPELSSEKFIPNPFNASTRLYKTGDLACYLEDGNIDFLGRIDDQVQIRGFRVEIGEIEQQTIALTGINECVVLLKTMQANHQVMVAYYVSENDNVVDPIDLKPKLAEYLPEYMIPVAFFRVPSIPKTPNGKVDKKALLALDFEMLPSKKRLAPRNEVEDALAELFKNTLLISDVGVFDNFFDLGGHSLLAIGLASKINKHFKCAIDISTLVNNPTIEALATILVNQTDTFKKVEKQDSQEKNIVIPLQPKGEKNPIFGVPGLGASALGFIGIANSLTQDQPFYGLDPPDAYDRAISTSVNHIARDNVNALKLIKPKGPYRLLGHSYGGWVVFEMAKLLLKQGEKIEFLILLDSYTPEILSKYQFTEKLSNDAHFVFQFSQYLTNAFKIDLSIKFEDFEALDDDDHIDFLFRKLVQFEIPVSKQECESYIERLKKDIENSKNYKPEPISQALNVIFFNAKSGDISVKAPQQDHGWDKLLANEVVVHEIPGDHFTMLESKNVHGLTKIVSHYNDNAC